MKDTKVTIPLLSGLNIIICLAFFFAKIFDKIDWSWWWIFSPLWIPIAIVFSIFILAFIVYLILLIIGIWK